MNTEPDEDIQQAGEDLNRDTANFFRAIGFVLLLASSAGLMLFLCAWSARALWSRFQGL